MHPPPPPATPPPPGIVIRLATPADVSALLSLRREIARERAGTLALPEELPDPGVIAARLDDASNPGRLFLVPRPPTP